jgi:hypothetical protein
MSNITAPLDYFLEGGSSEFSEHRAVAGQTRHISVFHVQDFKLVRVCSLDEFRMAVSMAGMVMLAFALDECRGATGRMASEFKDVAALHAMVSQGNHPRLIEAAIALRANWPREVTRLTGYQAGTEGYGRLCDACWPMKWQMVDTTQHGIASVYPRVKEALKYLKTHRGYTFAHEPLIHTVFGVLQKAHHLQFLDM